MALQAAIDGAGVLMGHEVLVSRALGAGSLVAPFPEARRYWPQPVDLAPDRPPAQAAQMIDWLLAQDMANRG